MPKRPASVPDLCISSRSFFPNEGVSFVLSSSRASYMAIRVASEIWPLVLIHTSVGHGVCGQFVFSWSWSVWPIRLFLRATTCIYHRPWLSFVILRRGAGICYSPLKGEEDPVVCCGESGDQFCFFIVIQAWPINDRWLWSRGFFSPNSFPSSSCVLEEGWDGNGYIPLVFGGLENTF